jgi:hypothetical protein
MDHRHEHDHDHEFKRGHGHRGHGSRGRRGFGPWAFAPGSFGPGSGFGPWGYRGRPGREEWVRQLEEYQKDLEQEAADVADLIRRLKADQPEAPTQAPSM